MKPTGSAVEKNAQGHLHCGHPVRRLQDGKQASITLDSYVFMQVAADWMINCSQDVAPLCSL